MHQATSLLLALLVTAAAAQPAPVRPPASPPAPTLRQASPVTPTPSKSYQAMLPDLIRQSRQIVLRVNSLKRADVAEAVRQAQINKGADVILITSKASLMERESLTMRLALMRTHTYLEERPGNPFIILDGVAYTGFGLVDFGRVNREPSGSAATFITWAQAFIDAHKKVDPVWMVREWTWLNLKIRLN
ncbi:hypothetical protein [Deinococcus ficus]|uniref:Phospholipase D-like domain-containing protein n=1 Tax=Deinococcus ficus TaxID=317577 RepID=A0A221T313_9DEIO|nr:hypothetical protein [Deinococcus ficus]ASN83289.1 hypothetical protein DFI_19005 [Deinococcus ficus]